MYTRFRVNTSKKNRKTNSSPAGHHESIFHLLTLLFLCVLNKQDLEKPGATLAEPARWIMLDGSWDPIFCRYWPGNDSHMVLMIKEIIPSSELLIATLTNF